MSSLYRAESIFQQLHTERKIIPCSNNGTKNDSHDTKDNMFWKCFPRKRKRKKCRQIQIKTKQRTGRSMWTEQCEDNVKDAPPLLHKSRAIDSKTFYGLYGCFCGSHQETLTVSGSGTSDPYSPVRLFNNSLMGIGLSTD